MAQPSGTLGSKSILGGLVGGAAAPVQADVQTDLAQVDADAEKIVTGATANAAQLIQTMQLAISSDLTMIHGDLIALITESQAWGARFDKALMYFQSIVPGSTPK